MKIPEKKVCTFSEQLILLVTADSCNTVASPACGQLLIYHLVLQFIVSRSLCCFFS